MTHLLNFWAVKHLSSFLAVKKKGKEKKNRRIEFYILKLRKLHLYLLPLSTHWRIIFRILSFRSISISVSFKYTSNFDTSKTLSFIWNQTFEIFLCLRFHFRWKPSFCSFVKKWDFIALRGIIIISIRTRANLWKRQASMHPRFLSILSLSSSSKESMSSEKSIFPKMIFCSRLSLFLWTYNWLNSFHQSFSKFFRFKTV